MARKPGKTRHIETLTHDEAARRNIPTAEYQSVMRTEEQNPIRVACERRNRDLDPQLVWRGKDAQDRSDLIVLAPPLYIQEKVHPKALIDRRLHRGGMRSKRWQTTYRSRAPLPSSTASSRSDGSEGQQGGPNRPVGRHYRLADDQPPADSQCAHRLHRVR